jgi:hypothetical protein
MRTKHSIGFTGDDFIFTALVLLGFAALTLILYELLFGPFKNDVCSGTLDSNLIHYADDAKQGIKTYYETLNTGDCVTSITLDTPKTDCHCDTNFNDNIKYLCISKNNGKNMECLNIGSITMDMTAFGNVIGSGNYRIEVSPQRIRVLNKI